MSSTFGDQPGDVVTSSRGDVLNGVSLSLYPTSADAAAGTNLLATVVTNLLGRWSYTHATLTVVWVRDPNGQVWSVEDPTANAAASTFNTGRGGVGNTAVGVSALIAATADQNTAVGYQALKASTTATQNTAVGYKALAATTTGGGNTAVGMQCLNLATGISNTAIGANAAQPLTTGNNNVAIGMQALWGGTTAGNNTAVGNFAGVTATTANKTIAGIGNTFVGYQSGPSSSADPSNSVAIGAGALAANTALAIGATAVASGVGSTAIGYGSSASAAGSVAIGRDNAGTGATTTTANEFVLGTTLHTVKVPGRLNVVQRTPTSGADAQGQVGDIVADDNYVYAKTSTGWKRTAITTW